MNHYFCLTCDHSWTGPNEEIACPKCESDCIMCDEDLVDDEVVNDFDSGHFEGDLYVPNIPNYFQDDTGE